MKHSSFDTLLIASRPDAVAPTNKAFTDRVMAQISSDEILPRVIRTMSVNKKETLFMKLRHLPKIAIAAIAVGGLLLLAGTTYAVVQTVSHFSNVGIDDSKTNEFGREQLSVTFSSCDNQKDKGATYELKRGSNLTTEDGAKVIQAQCDLDAIKDWITHDSRLQTVAGDSMKGLALLDAAYTLQSLNDTLMILENHDPIVFSRATRIVENGKITSKDTLKPGDSLIYFDPSAHFRASSGQTTEGVIFKLPLATRYYNTEMRSYVNARAACINNPERTCLKSNSINQTLLTVINGAASPAINDSQTMRNLQGKVVSYDNETITIDVGAGVTYTIHTPNNIIDTYNQSKVPTLGSYDPTFANTNPEDLKIKLGDSLDIYYNEQSKTFSKTLEWKQILTVNLMVERTVQDLSKLQKY